MPKLYLLTSDEPISTLTQKLAIAFETGAVSMVQIRRKHTAQTFDLMTLYREAEVLLSLADHYGVEAVMNDNLEIASHFGMGVHLSRQGASIKVAREILGDQVMIGLSCYGDLALVREAKKQGASYAAVGSVFAPLSRPLAQTIDMDKIDQAHAIGLPLCVIGGITLQNAPILQKRLHHTPHIIALTSDIMHHTLGTIAEQCRAWQTFLDNWQ